MMKSIALSLLLLITFFVNAQSNLYIQSIVVDDDTENPVEGAKVQVEDRNLTTYTNYRGFFLFNKKLRQGDYMISVSKEGYDTKKVLIKHRDNLTLNPQEVRININKKEAKRRNKIKRKREKEAKKRLKRLKKERLNKEKLLKEQKEKSLSEKNKVVVERKFDQGISEVQTKYAEILGVDVFKLTNKKLYEFIDKWMGTPYLWGGETKEAIDCSSFTQRLFIKSYNIYLERTAQKQSESKYTELFTDLNHLREGDLLFFGKDQFSIVHVGMYLHNNKFVHATATKENGKSGVMISSLKKRYWSKRLLAAGRRKTN